MKADIYNQLGKKTESIELPEVVFGASWNPSLVHQVAVAEAANMRPSVAHTKDRSERSGGGKKPWRQKGTGRARHGSSRSPIWRKGGVTFGPRNEKDFTKKVNKKMRAQALASVLSRKLKDGEVVFVDELSFDAPKTKQAKDILVKLSAVKGLEELATKRKNAALIAAGIKNDLLWKSFGNFGNVSTQEARTMTVGDLLSHKYVIVVNPRESVEALEARVGK